MKLPRWMVIGMLTSSVLAVLAAAGWWWVTWPERTPREFVERLAKVLEDEAWVLKDEPWMEGPLRSTSEYEQARRFLHFIARLRPDQELEPQSRSTMDFICGRQTFRITQMEDLQFSVQRGRVNLEEYILADIRWIKWVDPDLKGVGQ